MQKQSSAYKADRIKKHDLKELHQRPISVHRMHLRLETFPEMGSCYTMLEAHFQVHSERNLVSMITQIRYEFYSSHQATVSHAAAEELG